LMQAVVVRYLVKSSKCKESDMMA